jgi:hypothetical protein
VSERFDESRMILLGEWLQMDYTSVLPMTSALAPRVVASFVTTTNGSLVPCKTPATFLRFLAERHSSSCTIVFNFKFALAYCDANGEARCLCLSFVAVQKVSC